MSNSDFQNKNSVQMLPNQTNFVNGSNPQQFLIPQNKQQYLSTPQCDTEQKQQTGFNLKPMDTKTTPNHVTETNLPTISPSRATPSNYGSNTNSFSLNGGNGVESHSPFHSAPKNSNQNINAQNASNTNSIAKTVNQSLTPQIQNLTINQNRQFAEANQQQGVQQNRQTQLNSQQLAANNQSSYPYNFKTNALNTLNFNSNKPANNPLQYTQNPNQNTGLGSSIQTPQTNVLQANSNRPINTPQYNSMPVNSVNNNIQPNNLAKQQSNVQAPPAINQMTGISNNQFQNPPLTNRMPEKQSQPPVLLPNNQTLVNSHVQSRADGMQSFNQNYMHSQTQPPFKPQVQDQVMTPNYQNVSQVNTQQYLGSVTHQGFNRLWGQDIIDLMQHRHILTPNTMQTPKISLNNQFQESVNCNPDIMRCTLNRIPENNSLLQKSRLPLGILVHPFRDINVSNGYSLPVIQCPNIVRCRLCRTYINPFVHFVDSKMWKCNLCYRVNELPEDFQYDPASKTYGDVTRRPEVRSSTIEFIAPSEYMLRPPQPAIYLFLFDVSILAQQSGYLDIACSTLLKYLDEMPGDARAQVGFIAYNSALHFYNIADGCNQPREMTLVDIEDPFIPCPENLLVNLKECKDLVKDLLNKLPTRFAETHDPGSCLGAALQVAHKLMMASGGRVTVFQTCLPSKGVGFLTAREDPNNRSSKEVAHLNPATDFYKRHALECSGYQIAVDLFALNQQYVDLATLSGISKHSGGSVHHFPLFQKTKPNHVESFKQCFKRYLTRKIGFEAVMRIRCTRGLQVHTFHGNFFVRSTDLLSLPNVNPDAGYGMQISYEENLSDVKSICFQAALLYTNSEGERRIRVHTLCLPVTNNLNEVMHSADSKAIIGLLSKMAVDRSLASNLADAREAFINATIDILSAFKLAQNYPVGQSGQLMTPKNLSLLPLYILALLKHMAFRVGTSTRLDDRIAAMDAMKNLPLDQLMKYVYPEFYQIDALFYNLSANPDEDDCLPDIPLLQLTAEFLDSRSMFLIDSGQLILIYVGLNVPQNILENVLGVKSTAELPDICFNLPSIETAENCALKCFIDHLNEEKPYLPTIQIIRDTSTCKSVFMEKLIDDRSESSLSYYEFLQHLRTQVK